MSYRIETSDVFNNFIEIKGSTIESVIKKANKMDTIYLLPTTRVYEKRGDWDHFVGTIREVKNFM